MKPGDRRYTVETHRSGQQGAYRDSIYDFTLTVEWIAYKKREEGSPLEWEPNDLMETLVTKIAKSVGHGWVEKGEGDWASPHLTSKTKISPGKWRFVVTEEYTD